MYAGCPSLPFRSVADSFLYFLSFTFIAQDLVLRRVRLAVFTMDADGRPFLNPTFFFLVVAAADIIVDPMPMSQTRATT